MNRMSFDGIPELTLGARLYMWVGVRQEGGWHAWSAATGVGEL
ncbi:hypothetical protein Mal4_52680 [Maioricimonas rarisocia]|uniref:Uncharacterized protein n=1 Tax=Maioricimonas rarisocia TaxID=2528026 RepID=A0A517ZEH9_9PLAN|nr:hypothetical protein Mal4_52680 [Maioricimonas rarisocia]